MVKEAQEVVLQLTDGNRLYGLVWDFFDPSYRERLKQSEEWRNKEKMFLTSISSRVKWKWVREEKILAKGISGNLSSEVVYEKEVGFGVKYEVLSIRPEGDVVITENSKIYAIESPNPSAKVSSDSG